MSDDITLTRYSKWRPSGVDQAGIGLEDRQDWYVAPCIITRDSSYTDRANWDAMRECLTNSKFGDPARDAKHIEVHQFGHWACGWFEIVLIDPNATLIVREAQAIADALSDYPILDENKWSEYEWAETCEAWRAMSAKERRAKIRKEATYQGTEISSRDLDKWVKRAAPPSEFSPGCGWAELLGVV